MKRWLPAPLLSGALFVLWIFLVREENPGQMLLAVVVAVAMPLLMRPLRPVAGPIRHPLVLTLLILRVGGEVVRSALDVASGVLQVQRRHPRGTFVKIPLDLRNEYALASLAVISAVIPGTVWSEMAADRSAVLMHVFDLEDEEEFIHNFKLRYEKPLLEIFE